MQYVCMYLQTNSSLYVQKSLEARDWKEGQINVNAIISGMNMLALN